MRTALLLVAGAFALSACATSPKTTLTELNSRDAAYKSRDCVQARRQAAEYSDNKEGRVVIGLVGNLIVPFAGTALAAGMGALKEDDKKDLNHRLRASCTSDPLAGKSARVAKR